MLFFALLLPVPARADELSALFMRGCLPFAGQPAALRQWAARIGLPPAAAPAHFLAGATGRVFDASTTVGKFVLVSGDDGVCAAIAATADPGETITGIQAALAQAGVSFRMVIERDDGREGALHHREYLAFRGARRWRILAATERTGGRAMLTAAAGR